jgi:uracil-DNA glycosylase
VSRRLEILTEMGLAPVWKLRQKNNPPVSARAAETGGSREEHIARMDWAELKSTVSSCTACGLRAGCRQTVFGVGDESADWLLVGEAPGSEEDRLGEPFVGQAGKLLDNMLGALGLARGRNVYIANVLKCRPPGNRNPEPQEVATCAPYLRRQIELIQPKLVLAMGRFAVQALLNTDATIGSLRGRVHAYHGVPLVVTYHPAYLLRNLPDKAKAWADLVFAKKTIAAS